MQQGHDGSDRRGRAQPSPRRSGPEGDPPPPGRDGQQDGRRELMEVCPRLGVDDKESRSRAVTTPDPDSLYSRSCNKERYHEGFGG